jgi:type IV pilus assembly protein PilE
MRSQNGFTLLELITVFAIIGIITAIALPQYRNYVIRGKIPEATSTLSDMRVKMEQFYQDNRTYVGACAAGTVAPLPSGMKYFTFSCGGLSTTAYTVTATGGVAGGDQSMTGFTYTINETNTRATTAAPAGWAPTNATCWVTGRNGSC